MQPITTFASNLGTAILLLGPPGGGKSVLGCRLFPKTYVLVADLNFESPKRFLEKVGETTNVVGIDVLDVDEKGVPVPLQQRYPRMIKCLSEAEASPNVGTIFIDSATFLADVFMAKLTLATSIDTISWSKDKAGDYLRGWRSLINQLRISGKRLIISAHEKVGKGALDEILFNQINLWGGLRDALPNLVSDVWRCEVHTPPLPTGKAEYKVRVVGNTQNKLKNNYGWDESLLSAEEVIKRVRATLSLPTVIPNVVTFPLK